MVCRWGAGWEGLVVLHRSFHLWDHCLHMDTSGSPAAEPVKGKMRILNVTERFFLKGAGPGEWSQESFDLNFQL